MSVTQRHFGKRDVPIEEYVGHALTPHDRGTIAELKKQSPGVGEALEGWRKIDYPFLILLAQRRGGRIGKELPAIFECKDKQDFQRTLIKVCAGMGTVSIDWFCTPAVREIAHPILGFYSKDAAA